jgi:hypothetical protein
VNRTPDDCRDEGRPVKAVWHLVADPDPVIWATVLSPHPTANIRSAIAITWGKGRRTPRRTHHMIRTQLQPFGTFSSNRPEDDNTSRQLGFGMLRLYAHLDGYDLFGT